MSRRRLKERATGSSRFAPVALVAFAAFQIGLPGCGGEEPPPPPQVTVTRTPAAPPRESIGRVAAVRSAAFKAEELVAESPSGKRPLAPGGPLYVGDTVRTGSGLAATLDLGDNLTVDLGEGSAALLTKDGAGKSLTLQGGEAAITRAPGQDPPVRVVVMNAELRFGYGRVFFQAGKDRGLVRVDAGEILVSKAKRRLIAGEAVAIDSAAAIAEGPVPILPGPELPLAPLTPAPLRSPPPAPVLRGIGTLTARVPGSGEKSETALDLAEHRVQVTVRDGVAETRIEEAFTNRSDQTVEGKYRFLIPSGAAITRLALEVNGRIEEGEVIEKRLAKNIFDKIVEDSVRPRDPALLEWERGSAFTMRIYPIQGKETRRVFISYIEPMTAERGRYRYTYPLSAPTGTPSVGKFDLLADIALQDGVENPATPFYPSEIKTGEDKTTVHFAAQNYAPAADFVLTFAARKPSPGLRVAVQTDAGGNRYAMALLRPEGPPKPAGGVRVVLVLDKSYSIAKEMLSLAGATALELIAGFGPTDSFALIACADSCEALSRGFEFATLDTLKQAHAFVTSLTPGGASNLLGAFDAAFALARDGLPADVVYLGDAVPTSGELDPGRLIGLLRAIKPPAVTVHAAGLGPNADLLALSGLGARLGGSSYALSPGEAPVVAAEAIARRVRGTGIRNATVEWPAGAESAGPAELGSIPAGAEVAAYAKLGKGDLSGDLILRGTGPNGEPVAQTYPIAAGAGTPGAGFIGHLWASARLDRMTLDRADPKAIVALSGGMRVASRLTSWIVLENQKMYDEFNLKRTEADPGPLESAEFVSVEASEKLETDSSDEAAQAEGASEVAAPAAPPSADLREKAAAPSKPEAAPAGAPAIATAELAVIREAPRQREVEFGPPMPPSYKVIRLISDYAARLRAAPLSRMNHLRYVRLLARSGRPKDALKAAEEWHAVDPVGASALIALADQIARTGDRKKAIDLYATVAEIDPRSAEVHRRLAQAFRDLGEFRSAAGHYRAAAASGSAGQESWIDYLLALASGGFRALFDAETARLLGDRAYARIAGRVKALAGAVASGEGVEWPERRARGDLTVEMTLDKVRIDVDLAIIDPYGRRISGLWRQGASSEDLASKEREKLAVERLLNGVYRIVVSRSETESTAPVSGELTVAMLGESETVPFVLKDREIEATIARYRKGGTR